jgi:predicted transcriptional regulator
MAGRKTLALTDRQFEILELLWQHGPQTVREMLRLLPRGVDLPYTTLLGLVQTMEKAGLLAHDVEKQTHRYRPLVSQTAATRNLLSDFLSRFFQNSAQRLVLSLVDSHHLSPAELQEIERKLKAAAPAHRQPDQTKQPKKRSRKSS